MRRRARQFRHRTTRRREINVCSVERDLTTDTERRIDRGRYVFQKANPDLGTQERCRLQLRRQDQVFFQKHIQSPGATVSLPDPETLQESQQRIAENAQHIRRKLENLVEFLLRLERLAYFMFVCRYGINDRIARFAAVMDEVDPLPGRAKPIQSIALMDAEQAQFIEALEGPLYPKSRVWKPVLQRLDEALSTGGASYDDIISIEHVLPQTVADETEWAILFPEPLQRSYCTHRIANLVFLTKRINTRASNWDFEKKKKEYFVSKDGTSPFPLTQGVLRAEKWSVEHLIERQAQLVTKLKEVWELDPKPELQRPDLADFNEMDPAHRTGRELNQKCAIGARHALYRKDGTWYHRLERFPGALCDENGYVLFKTSYDLETCPGISIGKEKNWLSVPAGIATLTGYRRVESPSP